MSKEEEFIRAIQAKPDDDALRLVFADWLEEQGDVVRAEYLRLEHQFSTVPGRLKELTQQIDPGWVASVLRRPVRALLRVVRGNVSGVEYPIFEGQHYVGRADAAPADVDLSIQEPPERVWCSLQHALITWEAGKLFIEDLNSANGTYVNRGRVPPGQRRLLAADDIIQIGMVRMQVVL